MTRTLMEGGRGYLPRPWRVDTSKPAAFHHSLGLRRVIPHRLFEGLPRSLQ
jgi:hypothetical protein